MIINTIVFTLFLCSFITFTQTSIAHTKCVDYAKQICGTEVSLEKSDFSTEKTDAKTIVEPNHYPHAALIGYEKNSKVTWACSGSLISQNFVLGAAHCAGTKYFNIEWLRLGEFDQSVNNSNVKDFKISEKYIHPQYKANLNTHDIALIKFDGLKEFNDYIRPICLNSFDDIGASIVTSVGWGRHVNYETPDTRISPVNLKIVDNSKCLEKYDKKFNATTMTCIAPVIENWDACQGYGGAPVQLQNSKCSKIYLQTGLVSFGTICGDPDIPSVAVKLKFFLPWIEKIVWETKA